MELINGEQFLVGWHAREGLLYHPILLNIQLHDSLLKISHTTMDQFSASAAGP